MHKLILSIVAGICGITCLILVGQQQALLPGTETPNKSTPETTLAQTNTSEAKRTESIAPDKAQPKELASKDQPTTPKSPDPQPIATPVQSTEQQPKEAPTVAQEELESIDTMDLEQPEGNWLTKRIYWKNAKNKYKKCREVFEAIFSSRMTFLEKRSELEKTTFNPFYREIGLEYSELQDLLRNLIDYIEQEREETGFLTEKERAYLEKITAAKNDLEQFKLDIESINNIDTYIDKAVSTLSNKINEAHRFEQSAWDEFEAIAHELSDKRAYERYYVIDGIHNNLKELQKYISEEFTNYFNNLVKSAQEKTEKAKKEAQALKDKDIDLREQVKMFITEEEAAQDEQERLAAQKAAEEAKKPVVPVKVSFFCKMWLGFVGFFKSLWNLLFGWWLYKI